MIYTKVGDVIEFLVQHNVVLDLIHFNQVRLDDGAVLNVTLIFVINVCKLIDV